MAGFTFNLKGADKLLKKLNEMPTKIQVKVDESLKYSVADINAEQVIRVPKDTGRLAGSITFYKLAPMDYVLEAGTDYAAYVEFGTGGLVDVPNGLENYAMQFKGAGIRQVNLPARPYFFPPFIAKQKEIIEDIKRILKQL